MKYISTRGAHAEGVSASYAIKTGLASDGGLFMPAEIPSIDLEYIRELSLEDYFSEHVTGKHAKTSIINAWKTSRKSFEISKKTNELRYNAGQTYEADRLMKELPETLEARKSREWVVMNLEEAKDFFGIDFKKSIIYLR